MRKGGFLSKGAAFALAIAALGPAVAQSPHSPVVENGKRSFPPEFFNSFGPVNALDMVRRIPGFSVEDGGGRRGFGENAGNVLIDGDRPSTKSDNILTILSRIPASQVERIELIEQAGADGETRGVGQSVNVIRKASAAITGTYEASTYIGTREGVTPFGEASATLKRGNTSFEVNAGFYDEIIPYFGPEDFQNGSRVLIERRAYRGQGRYREATLGGAIKTRLGEAKLNTNAQIKWQESRDFRNGAITDSSGASIGTERLLTNGPLGDFSYEIGADIEFSLAPKLTSKLIGLYRTGDERADGLSEQIRTGRPTRLFETNNSNRPTETVFRIQNDWTGIQSHAIQFGAELAYNRLDARFSGRSSNGGGPANLSSSTVLVRETRLEPFVSDVWSLSPEWKIEGGAIFEFSRLRLTGDSRAARRFSFIKPRIAATWTASKATTLEFRAENQVSQLDFNEFATSIDLSQGNQVDSGNRNLVPERTTTFSALVRQKFFDRGSIQLLGSYVLVSDTLDLVPIDAGGGEFFDGAGNIRKSRRWNVELEITLPFDWLTRPIGVTGMELKYVGHYHGARVTDPVTGEHRGRSFNPVWHQSFEFRHDLPKVGIAYGFDVQARAVDKAYFVSQFRSQQFLPNLGGFIEYKKFKFGTLRLAIEDLTGKQLRRHRFLYDGTRASGVVTDIIDRKRAFDPRILLRLSGKF